MTCHPINSFPIHSFDSSSFLSKSGDAFVDKCRSIMMECSFSSDSDISMEDVNISIPKNENKNDFDMDIFKVIYILKL